jgi:hypothetical protein
MRPTACTLFAKVVYDFKFMRDGTNPHGGFTRAAKVVQSERVYFLKLAGHTQPRVACNLLRRGTKAEARRVNTRGHLIVSSI